LQQEQQEPPVPALALLAQLAPPEQQQELVLALSLLAPLVELEQARALVQVPKPSHLCGFRVLRPATKRLHQLNRRRQQRR
jgi:hypothetical protein